MHTLPFQIVLVIVIDPHVFSRVDEVFGVYSSAGSSTTPES